MSKYKRVLLKLSGEALAGDKGTGFDEATCVPVAKQIKDLVDAGTEVAIVIGGGNFLSLIHIYWLYLPVCKLLCGKKE